MSLVCHAELNAILNKNSFDVKGCTMYVALFPCNECAKLIIQSGISEVVYVSDKYRDKDKMKASRKLMDMAKVQYRYYHLPSSILSVMSCMISLVLYHTSLVLYHTSLVLYT